MIEQAKFLDTELFLEICIQALATHAANCLLPAPCQLCVPTDIKAIVLTHEKELKVFNFKLLNDFGDMGANEF